MAEKLKALVVDDDVSLGKIFKASLELCGFEVRHIDDSTDAMEEIARYMPDIITLDMQMPKVSGREILQNIRADETLSHIRVILVTASGQAAQDASLRELADLILLKPVTLTQIADFAARLTKK